MIKITKKVETVKFKKYTMKIRSSFMIYADSESILIPEKNVKQNPDDSYVGTY